MKKILATSLLAVALSVLLYATPGSSQISPSSPRGSTPGTAAYTQGTAAHDAPIAGNPNRIGGRARTSTLTAVGNDDAVDWVFSTTGIPALSSIQTPSDGTSNTSARFVGPDGAGRDLGVFPYVFNGTTWDRRRGDTNGTWSQGPVAHDSPAAGNPVQMGAIAFTTVPTAVAEGDVERLRSDVYGHLFVRQDHLNRFRCTVAVSTATTIQAVGGSCAAPGAGLSLYITDILFSTNAAGIAADSFNTLKYGTGGTCGTGTTVFWAAFTAAATQAAAQQSLATPIKIPANNEICWINTTAGSKFLVISGFIAP